MSNDLLDLINRLEREHVEVREALATIGPPAEDGDLEELAARLPGCNAVLGAALDEHSRLEDDQLFPAIAPFLSEEMVAVFVDEHARITALRDQLYSGTGRRGVSAEVCLDLCELLGGHIDREEQALFPAARSVLSD